MVEKHVSRVCMPTHTCCGCLQRLPNISMGTWFVWPPWACKLYIIPFRCQRFHWLFYYLPWPYIGRLPTTHLPATHLLPSYIHDLTLCTLCCRNCVPLMGSVFLICTSILYYQRGVLPVVHLHTAVILCICKNVSFHGVYSNELRAKYAVQVNNEYFLHLIFTWRAKLFLQLVVCT